MKDIADRERTVLKFGEIPTRDAASAILAHTARLPARVLRKGHLLQAEDVEALLEAGYQTIIAARLEPGDLAEDEAARRLASSLLTPGLSMRLPGTGRANIVADLPGLFRADAGVVDTLNAVDDSLTLGTLADATQVSRGALVATVKIIPFAAPGMAVERASDLARTAPPLRLVPFRPLIAGLVMTTLPGLKTGLLEATSSTMQARITRLTGRLLAPLQCAHTTEAIAEAIRCLLAQNARIVLVAGASAVADRHDVAPSGIVAAGGEIIHFGMPVDPGNLLCLGRIGDVPALVLPGCARSPALNGIDFVLARLYAGEQVRAADIRGMGVGGLVKEYAGRPAPRKNPAPR